MRCSKGWIALALASLVLSSCDLGKGADEAKPNPITGSQIATTTLDAPAPAPAASLPPAPQTSPEAAPEATSAGTPQAPVAAAEPLASPAPAPEEPPPPPASPAEAKCLKSGGIWANAGKSTAKTCVKRTKDAGRSCTRQTQCEGFCLARSRTCAPIAPMFGCNDILQADGREATLCID